MFRVCKFTVYIILCMLFVCGGAVAAAPKPIVLKMSATQPLDFPTYLSLQELERLLNEKAPGRFEISLYGNMTLGADAEVARQIRAGTVQFGGITTANLSNISPMLAVCDLPYLFENSEEAQAVLSGPIGKKLLDSLGQSGLVGLEFCPFYFRQIFNSKHPVKQLSDITGLKLRTSDSKLDIAAAQMLGASPTPISHGEIYSAIEQKVIEGVLHIPELVVGSRWHEVSPYLTYVDVQLMTVVWVTNAQWLNSLPDDLRAIFLDCVRQARIWQGEYAKNSSTGLDEKMRNEGVTIDRLDDAARAELRTRAQKLWQEFELPGNIREEMFAAKAALKK